MADTTPTSGPLSGFKIVELGGLGAAPFAAMVLADLGADVVRIVRPGHGGDGAMGAFDVLHRNRDVVELDLKQRDDVNRVLALTATADGFIESFRPGVAERLGVGPDDCFQVCPRLVYGRMTGWGQDGPLAPRAGHDLTYASIAGAIAHIGRRGQPPTPPLNLLGDFGGGGMLLALGMIAALHPARATGVGQVIDAAMVDGVALLLGPLWGAHATGFWSDERGTNMLDSGAPWYDCYRCRDGGHVSVAAIEAPFYAALLDGLDLDPADLPDQHDEAGWPRLREAFTTTFATRTRSEWTARFRDTDACVAPVLTMGEAPTDAHIVARNTVIDVDGAPQPAPAPRFSRTPTGPVRPAAAPVTYEAVADRWGA